MEGPIASVWPYSAACPDWSAAATIYRADPGNPAVADWVQWAHLTYSVLNRRQQFELCLLPGWAVGETPPHWDLAFALTAGYIARAGRLPSPGGPSGLEKTLGRWWALMLSHYSQLPGYCRILLDSLAAQAAR